MDLQALVEVGKGVFKAIPYIMYGLLFLSAFAQWWPLFTWVAGSMIIGAVLAGIVTDIQRDFAKLPIIGGYAGAVGGVLHVLSKTYEYLGAERVDEPSGEDE